MSRVSEAAPVGVSELEALLEEEVPCGGNACPKAPCPYDAPAVLRCSCCPHATEPTDFKCVACYSIWLASVIRSGGSVYCHDCGRVTPANLAHLLYRPF